MKASGEKAWGKSVDQVAMIVKAREQGQIVTADQYPYIASSTSLSATVIPTRFREGTDEKYKARLNDAEQLALLRRALEDQLGGRRAKAIFIASHAAKTAWQGKNLETIAQEEKVSVVDLVLTIERNGGAGIVNFGMNEEDVRYIMKQEFVATASDSSSMVPAATVPHPRAYGTFPRKIGRYALDDGIVTLEHALRSASGLPADILRLKERGYVRNGYAADLVVFDPKAFRDTATFEKPHQYAPGVRHLFVNGRQVIADGKFTGTLAGTVLSHNTECTPTKP
jgi:N-acyl-D-aspartate/D-glutamate deacylase